MKVLFVCTGNSCRSQMAEGILKFLKPEFEVFSAGVKPEKEISLCSVKVLTEKGIDINKQYPKSVDMFKNKKFDFLITLSESAKNGCKDVVAGRILHFDIEDPFGVNGSENEIINTYREVRNEIIRRISDIFKIK